MKLCEKFNTWFNRYYRDFIDYLSDFTHSKLVAPVQKFNTGLKEKNKIVYTVYIILFKFVFFFVGLAFNLFKLAYLLGVGIFQFIWISITEVIDGIIDFPGRVYHYFTKKNKKKEGFTGFCKRQKREWKVAFKNDWILYVLFLPVFIWIILFWYLPKYGLIIAFMDYNAFQGMSSPWVGLSNFTFFSDPLFLRALANTFILSIYGIVFTFPLSIILALMINEVRNKFFKKTVQTVVFLPYFMSSVVVVGVFVSLLAFKDGDKGLGLVNLILVKLNGVEFFQPMIKSVFGKVPIDFLYNSKYAVLTYFATGIYKNTGYGTLVYIAALTAIDPSLYEAAKMDGATKMQEMKYITIPCIMSTIVIMLILKVGGLISAGTERIILIYNVNTYESLDTIGTLVYRLGIENPNQQESLAAAIGLFESVVSVVLVYFSNRFAKRTGNSLW